MKLCFVADVNHANAATWLEYFASDLGHEVHAISFTPVNREVKNVSLYDCATRNKVFLPAMIPVLRSTIRRINPELVIAYRVQSYGFLCACVGFHPLVIVAQSRTVVWPPKSKIMAWICKYAIRRADWILSWADHTTRKLISLGAERSIIDTFPRGVRPELFFPSAESRMTGSPVIISTRSLEPDYDHEQIIRAVQELVKIFPRLKYQLAGEGREREYLETVVHKTGLSSNIEFLGYVTNRDLPDRLRQADVYVSVFLEDGVSMSLLEVMACGVLPVAPDTEPNRQWIEDGVNGLLFRPNDHSSLVDKLKEALSNVELQKNAREYNVEFIRKNANWHTNMRRIEARFRKVIENTPQRKWW
jgi:L-malate glycosyltransferase